ncbi:glycosyltransferase family 61 protein [Alteromonas lipolytica]|uniref:Glycosyltransferase 61 catalytic domain-containing protein n=1 Tax=Alteromonas lipolytica TaxID=1856405 RepID=A0A1E8FI05_9ALTE|nr:glycosyltransferase family 61 protein [Alteromonas lipolytica]OFI35577.1 hypothetical protein BFC17_12520 [Alteromonas lipolytica]GGF77329.1 hypothetical protein GCM10011338_32060 [Alteromonas lipolytica]
MNKRIIFHVGPPKTGSSAIQHFLHQHRQQLRAHSVLYPAHSIDKNGISSGNAREICSPDSQGRLALDRSKLTSVINAFNADPTVSVLLLSSESFFRIIHDLIDAVPAAEFICFLRNPIEFQLSIYNQSVKRHANSKPFVPGKTLNMGQWENILKASNRVAPQNIHCFAYKSYEDHGNIIDDVISVLGLSTVFSAESRVVNVSYSFAALELKRWLNQFNLDAVQAELDAYLQLCSKDTPRYRLLDDATLATYASQLQSLAGKFTGLLSAEDWQLIGTATEKMAALPLLKQEQSSAESRALITKMRSEKPALYRALSLVVEEASASVSNHSLCEHFTISSIEQWRAKLAGAYKYLLSRGKNLINQTTPAITECPPDALDTAQQVKQVTVIPQLPGSGPANVKGGLRAESLPDFAHHYRFAAVIYGSKPAECATNVALLASQPAVKRYQKGEYFYGGPIFSNFGHFIAESVHRLSALPAVQQRVGIKKVIFLPQHYRKLGKVTKPALPPHFYEILQYFGVARSQLHISERVEGFESLWVAPQQSYFRDRGPVSAHYKTFLQQCEARAGIDVSAQLPQKLYISRTPYLLRGGFAGETVIEQYLEQQGFAVFRPENYPITEQLRHYKSASEIVLAEGAALHVMELLGHTDARITVLQRRQNTDQIFRPLLSARCNDVDFFGELTELPSLFVNKQQKSAAHGSALSVLHGNALKQYLQQRLGIGDFDAEAFNAQIRQDIPAYYRAYAPELLKIPEVKDLPASFVRHVTSLQQQQIGQMPANWDLLD